jgi:hypothetical protein
MSDVSTGRRGGGAIPHDGGRAFPLGAADWLHLAAAPTFAIMALLTGFGRGQMDMLCSTMQDASPLSGMVPMYLLMSAFHSAPWLKLVSSRRSGARRTLADTGPTRADDMFVQAFPGPESEGEAVAGQQSHGGRALGDDRGMVAHDRTGHRRHQADLSGCIRQRSQDRPGERRMPLPLEPRAGWRPV